MPHQAPTTKKILQRNITALNSRNIEAYIANQHPDIEIVSPDGSILRGREQVKQFTQSMLAAFPDGQLTFKEKVFSDDAMAVEVVFTGTQTGPIMTPNGPLPPTGKRVVFRSASILRVKDGLIASEHIYAGQPDLMTQLGMKAGPAAPANAATK